MDNELKEAVREIFGESAKLAAIYELKLGALRFSRANAAPIDGSWPNRVREIVRESLRKHPNVFAVENMRPERKLFSNRIDEEGLLRHPSLLVRVNIPQHQQKLRFFGIETTLESFSVIANGSLFCAYARLPAFPAFTHFAQEYRELLCATLGGATGVDAEGIGPTPIHPTVYVVQVANDSDKPAPVATREIGKDTLVLFVPAEASIDEVVDDFLWETSHTMELFYVAKLAQYDVENQANETLERFREVTKLTEMLTGTSSFRVLRRGKLAAQITHALSLVYQALVEEQVSENRHSSRVTDLKNNWSTPLFYRSHEGI